MQKIIVIGTVHGGFTPDEELKEVFEEYSPKQLFVEVAEEHVKKNKLKDYPPEMIFTLRWAKENKLQVNCFDIVGSVLKKGVTKKEIKDLIEESSELVKKSKLTWKDMNKEKNLKLLDTPNYLKISDRKKEKVRELKMLVNIKKAMLKSGTILIVTGVGHLKFFEMHFKNAKFPFRK